MNHAELRRRLPTALTALVLTALAAGAAPPEETLPAGQFVPADLMQGDRYRVAEQAVNDGCTNRYTVVSDYGAFEAPGDAMLRTRIDEVRAIAKLRELNKAKAAAGGFRESALKRWLAVKKVFTHPVRTAKDLPKGTARYFGNYYRMLKGGRGELEEPAAKELIRFSAAKRGVAAYVGADPYSSNPVLQDELNDAAWAAYTGGLTIEVGRLFIPANEALTALELTTTTVGMAQAFQSQSPESLRAVNKKRLVEMGFDPTLIRDFLRHDWYSPRHETLLVDALFRMKGVENREAFLRLAMTAEDEQDAFTYQRTAEMLAGYHERVAPLARLADIAGLPAGYTPEGKLIIALPADYVRWTDRNAALADAVVQAHAPEHPNAPIELWLSGGASPEALQELQLRGVAVHQKTDDRLLPPPEVVAQPVPQ